MADQNIEAVRDANIRHDRDEKDIVPAQHIENDYEPDLKDHMNYDRVDKEVAKYASDTAIYISPEENKRLKNMINTRVLVVMVFTYFIQALDKGTLSFSSIMGIQTDAGLVDAQYSWLTTAIYIAILIVEYPTNWVLARVPVAKYLGISIILWGTVLMLHSVAKNFTHLLILRILLGIFECVCQPAFVLLSSMWFKREEQAATIAIWYMMNGGQQIVGGLLAYCFTLISSPPSPIKSWQALFLAYGAVSVVWGFFVLWWMPDSPMRAKCFTEEDKKLMIERVRSNQTGMQNRRFRKEQFFEAFRDPQMYCHGLIAICTTFPTSGLGAFFNIVIKGLHFSTLQTQLLAMVLGAYIIIVLISSTYLANKYKQNLLVMLFYVIPSFVGTIVLMTVINTNDATRAGLLISYYLVLSFWAAQTLNMTLITRTLVVRPRNPLSLHSISFAGLEVTQLGAQIFLTWDAPRYFIAFSAHMGCYVLLVLVLIYLRWYLMSQNKKKDLLQAELAASGTDAAVMDEQMVHAFDDLTDQENMNFRYVF